jgi:hypothetical protein
MFIYTGRIPKCDDDDRDEEHTNKCLCNSPSMSLTSCLLPFSSSPALLPAPSSSSVPSPFNADISLNNENINSKTKELEYPNNYDTVKLYHWKNDGGKPTYMKGVAHNLRSQTQKYTKTYKKCSEYKRLKCPAKYREHDINGTPEIEIIAPQHNHPPLDNPSVRKEVARQSASGLTQAQVKRNDKCSTGY